MTMTNEEWADFVKLRRELKIAEQARRNAEKGTARLANKLEAYQRATGLCDKCKPNRGAVGCCQRCALIELSAIISQIDYAFDAPNEYQVSLYDIDADHDRVLKRVKEYVQAHGEKK